MNERHGRRYIYSGQGFHDPVMDAVRCKSNSPTNRVRAGQLEAARVCLRASCVRRTRRKRDESRVVCKLCQVPEKKNTGVYIYEFYIEHASRHGSGRALEPRAREGKAPNQQGTAL